MAQPISDKDLVDWLEHLFAGAPEDEKGLISTLIRRYKEARVSMEKVTSLEQ